MLVTFDLDGVLMKNPFGDGVFPEVKRTIKEQYFKFNEFQPQIEKVIWDKIIDEYKRRLNSKKSYIAYDWDGIVQQVADDMGCPGGVDVSKLVQKYCRYPYIKYYDEPHNVLKWLKEKQIHLQIITNGYYKYQYPVLKALKLNHFFEEIITPEVIGHVKPDKNIFLQIQQQDRYWYHVGDSLIDDILGANNVEAIPVWLQRNLSADLKRLSPAERVQVNEGMLMLDKKLKEELRLRESFSDVTLDRVKPRYIISSIAELRTIIK